MTKSTIKIDIVSDVVCPWCYIGKRRLERAITQLSDHYDFEIEYLPFELNPEMPSEGRDQKQYLSNKFGGQEKVDQITQHITGIAAEEGLKFDFQRQHTSPNTLDAHRLIGFAKAFSRQPDVQEALMSAYFEQGIDLSKRENLIQIAVKCGLDESTTRLFLDSEEGVTEVRFAEQLNYRRKISGVPFFIVNKQYGISGAQPATVFVEALTQIGSEMKEQTATP